MRTELTRELNEGEQRLVALATRKLEKSYAKRGRQATATLTHAGKRCLVCREAIQVGQPIFVWQGSRLEHMACAFKAGGRMEIRGPAKAPASPCGEPHPPQSLPQESQGP